MNFSLSPEDLAFQQEVRAFLAENLPADIPEKSRNEVRFRKDDYYRWQRVLFEKGWIAPFWPVEYGGCGWSPIRLNIFDEECFAAGAPRVLPFGIRLVGPVIYTFGNDAQKEHYLPRILSSEDFWCQGFSEPNAGSDLASLRTSARREGDYYVLNGQKTWTSYAQYADWIFVLARTNPDVKKQEGISFLLVDMKAAGITVRPIRTIDGDHVVNEVFFDNVRVPAENLVGEENKGWTYAKFLLGNERTGIAGVGASKADFRRLVEIAQAETRNGKPLIEDPHFSARMMKLKIELRALELTNMRMLASGDAAAASMASILKVRGSEIQQQVAELQRDALGLYSLPWQAAAMEPEWNGEKVGPGYAHARNPSYFDRRKVTIYGGSSEVQKTIIARDLLAN